MIYRDKPLHYHILTFSLIFLMSPSCENKSIQQGKHSKYYSMVRTSQGYRGIVAKRAIYLKLLKKHEDKYGWLDFACDGLLFNSLYAFSGGNVGIDKARSASGKWFRTTDHSCYPNRSGSDLSKDMVIGLMLYLYSSKRFDDLKRLSDYGKRNLWIMGRGPYASTILMHDQRRNLALALESLSGKTQEDRDLPSGFGIPCKGYGCHLRALDIYLHHLIHKSIPKVAFKDLEVMVRENPSNALYRSIIAPYKKSEYMFAINLLNEEKFFPKNMLPTNRDYCTDYLYQRPQYRNGEINKDWLPCKVEKQHFGVSFLFATQILMNSLED